MPLADQIRARREQLGLSKAALGRAVGVTGQAVSMWESGARSIPLDTLERIAGALGTSAVQLQGGNDSGHISHVVLAASLESLEAATPLPSVALTVQQRANVLCYIYEKGGSVSASEVVALIRLVA